jgi:DNA-binding NtrC family response regulator
MTHPASAQPTTILVAHENAGARLWLVLALRGLGHVRQVDSGDEVERLALSDYPPSLVVVSASLPDKTGMQVLAAVRAAGRMMPFVIVSDFSAGHVLALVSELHGTRVARRVLGRHGLRLLALRLLAQSAGSTP